MVLPAAQCLVPSAFAQAASVASARLWPSPDYTRVIVESSGPLVHQITVLKNPDRIVLDIEGVESSSELAGLPARVQPNDPYIGAIRFGRRGNGAARVVLDLRGEVRPDLFALKPVGEYGYRLVLDLYPLVPLDPRTRSGLIETARTLDPLVFRWAA